MGTDTSSNRQLANLRDLSSRVDSAEGLAGFLGIAMRVLIMEPEFASATVSIVRDAQYCETVAVAGSEALREKLLDTRFPVASYQAAMAAAETWGVLCYSSSEQSEGIGVLHAAAAELRNSVRAPAGVLHAPLNSDTDQLIGMITAELAHDAAKPGIAAQRVLAEIAEIAGNAIEGQVAPTAEVPARPGNTAAPTPATVVLERPGFQDPVTGLPNREGLEEVFTATLQRLRKDGSTAAVLLCVLDEYESIEQNLGTEIATEVLREVSKRLQDSVRTYDVVARVSSNTMAIVADHIAPGDTNTLVSRLRRSLAKVHIVQDEVIRVRGAVGVALVNPNSEDTTEILREAELASDEARNGTGGTYVLYSRYARTAMATTRR